MQIKLEEISRIIREQIQDFDSKVEVQETGSVLTVGDGIARVYGLERRWPVSLSSFRAVSWAWC